MNLCFIIGKIISEIEFKFVSNSKNTSIAIFQIELDNKNIIEIIYQAEENGLDEIIKEANKKVKGQIKDINIKKLLEETSKPNELKKSLEKIEENYSIKIAQYNQEFYKQGFIDGVNLMINCLKI